jgi:hypothetical protein
VNRLSIPHICFIEQAASAGVLYIVQRRLGRMLFPMIVDAHTPTGLPEPAADGLPYAAGSTSHEDGSQSGFRLTTRFCAWATIHGARDYGCAQGRKQARQNPMQFSALAALTIHVIPFPKRFAYNPYAHTP